jgi:hypothetical protein
MKRHADRMHHIRQLCDHLVGAVDASFRVREHAEELSRAAEELARATPPERRSVPRLEDAKTTAPSESEIDSLLGPRPR